MIFPSTMQELTDHFNIDVSALVDNCFAVSSSIIHEFPELGGRLGRGKWTGDIAVGSYFRWLHNLDIKLKLGIGGISHCWVILPNETVIDATRWVFEGVEPYIYRGISDHYLEGKW